MHQFIVRQSFCKKQVAGIKHRFALDKISTGNNILLLHHLVHIILALFHHMIDLRFPDIWHTGVHTCIDIVFQGTSFTSSVKWEKRMNSI